MSNWKFISNHGAVLVLIDSYEKITTREIAAQIGITERSVARILRDLEEGGYLERARQGRRNVYSVALSLPLRQEIGREIILEDVLNLFRDSLKG